MSKNLSENMGMADRLILVCRDKEGKVKWTYDSKDHPEIKSMAKTGMAEVAALIVLDVGGTAFDYIGIGEGSTAPTADDTDLETPTKRKAATGSRITTSFANDTCKWEVTFSSGDGLSGSDTITEGGIFNAAAAGIMLFRKTATGKTVNWDDGDTLVVTAICQMVQGS